MVTDLAWKIPDNISYEQAATVSVGLYSATMCMTHPKRLNMAEWPNKVSSEQWVSNAQRTAPTCRRSRSVSSVLYPPPLRIF